MNKLIKIYNWIDQEMHFDKWYQVKTEEQKQAIIKIMDSGLIPDCEFKADYSEFRKSKLAFQLLV